MIVGTTKELKNHEYRVGLTPDNVSAYVAKGHTVYVETRAGEGCGFTDEDYRNAGGIVVGTAAEVFAKADMIVKVKEPEPSEYKLLRENQILFTYLHLAPNPRLAEALMERGVKAVAYETITDKEGNLPCLRPMSQVAGRLSIQEGAKYIERSYGGRGILMGGVPGVERGKIVIIGGGIAGTYAAKAAVGMDAQRVVSLPQIHGTDVMTVTEQVAVLLPSSVFTVMVAVPALTAVTLPSDTVATVLSLELQITFLLVALEGLTVAVRVVTSPSVRVTEVLSKVTFATENTSGRGS